MDANNEMYSKKSLSYYFVRGEGLRRLFDTSAMGIGLINSFLTIKFLSVFHFGLFQLILAFISILDGLSIKSVDGPLSAEIRHYLQSGEASKAKRLFLETVVWRIILSLIFGAIIFFGSEILAGWYDNDISFLIKIVSPLLFFLAIQSISGIFLKAVISFAHWSFAPIREIVKLVALLAFLILGNFTILEVAISHIIAVAFASMIIAFGFLLKEYNKVFVREKIKVYKKYITVAFLRAHGFWLFLRYGVSRLTKNTIPFFIKFFINTEAVAFYSLATNLVALIEGLMPIAGFSTLFMVKMEQRNEMAFLFKRTAKYALWFGIVLLAIGTFVVPPIVVLTFPKYGPAIPLFQLMLLALPIYGIYKLLKSVLSVLREYKILTLRLMNEVVIVSGGSIIFLPIFGLLGSGIVYIATFIERTIFFYKALTKKYPVFRIKFKNLFTFDSLDKKLIIKIFKQSLAFIGFHPRS